MRKSLIGMSALTCLLGGSMLAAPASGQRAYIPCSDAPFTYCSQNGARGYCDMNGSPEPMFCYNNRWMLA